MEEYKKVFGIDKRSRFEKEKEIYEKIEERLKFLSNENNIIDEINKKKELLDLDKEEKEKEYREIFCSKEGFKYILKYIRSEQKENEFIIYLEKADCVLKEFARIFHEHFTFPQIRYIMYQLLQGIMKLHNLTYDLNIFHNDLKTENIFVIINDKDMKIEFEKINNKKENKLEGISNIGEFLQKLLKVCTFKIGDFDLSHVIRGEFKNIDFIPGPIEDIIDVDKEDCYELGCILYYLKAGQYFQYNHQYSNYSLPIFKKPSFEKKIKITSNYVKLLNKMLQVDKNFRLNCDDILSMDFFKIDNIKNVDLLNTEMENDTKFIDFDKDIYDCFLNDKKTIFYLPIEDRGTFKLKSEKKVYKITQMIGDFFISNNI